MIATYGEKHYNSANKRLFKNLIGHFFMEHVPQIGGPELREFLAYKLIDFIEMYMPLKDRLKPGQMLWTAVSKHTRADSKKVRYKPVILTLVTEEEIKSLVNEETSPPGLLTNAIVRLLHEAYKQDALLSMRDIGLILKRMPGNISILRKQYEIEHNTVLPTPATLQDMGSGVTHKVLILQKILLEKKDMYQVRNETNHTQQAIDRYLKDYRRVEMLLDDDKELEYIHRVTGMSKHLIKQYLEIYNETKCLQTSP